MKLQARAVSDRPDAAARQILDSLVEQELAAQAARATGLDKDPAVLQLLQIAQREVLARAYQDRLASSAAGPGGDEIGAYFDKRPELFAERRLYMLQESGVEAAGEHLDQLRSIVVQARTPADIPSMLRGAGFVTDTRQYVKAAEDLPFDLLEALAKLSAGQSHIVALPRGALIFTVLQVQRAPVDRRRAHAAISSFLLEQSRREQVQQGMQSLRRAAQIEIKGGFASPTGGAEKAAMSN
jgi:EpsD family peptidyl-prolyl cis-trans isomerase